VRRKSQEESRGVSGATADAGEHARPRTNFRMIVVKKECAEWPGVEAVEFCCRSRLHGPAHGHHNE